MSMSDRARAALRPLALVVLMACAATPARAQEPLTRADSAAVLIGAAERLEAEGADELADALARLVIRRYADTAAAARASTLLAGMAETRTDQSGRVELIAFSTLYGAWLGIAVPLMFGAEDPEAYGLGLILGAPAGFLGGRAWTQDRSVSAGDARAITFGATWGTWQGAGWQIVTDFGAEEVCDPSGCYESDSDVKYLVGSMVGGGLLGIAAGAIAANNADITPGTATLVNFGALWGSWYGVVAGVLTDLDNHEDGILTAALIGGDVGLGAMAVIAPRLDMSRNRARLVNAAGLIGLAVGGGIDLIILPENENVAIMIPAIGSTVGLWAGAHLTRDYDRTPSLRRGSLEAPTDASGALVRLRRGEWRVATPLPSPTLIGVGAPGTRRSAAAVLVPILDARF